MSIQTPDFFYNKYYALKTVTPGIGGLGYLGVYVTKGGSVAKTIVPDINRAIHFIAHEECVDELNRLDKVGGHDCFEIVTFLKRINKGVPRAQPAEPVMQRKNSAAEPCYYSKKEKPLSTSDAGRLLGQIADQHAEIQRLNEKLQSNEYFIAALQKELSLQIDLKSQLQFKVDAQALDIEELKNALH